MTFQPDKVESDDQAFYLARGGNSLGAIRLVSCLLHRRGKLHNDGPGNPRADFMRLLQIVLQQRRAELIKTVRIMFDETMLAKVSEEPHKRKWADVEEAIVHASHRVLQVIKEGCLEWWVGGCSAHSKIEFSDFRTKAFSKEVGADMLKYMMWLEVCSFEVCL